MGKIGYTAGTLANLQDAVAGFNESINETRAEQGGGILHARRKGEGYDISVSHVNEGVYKYDGENKLLQNLGYAGAWSARLDDGRYYGGAAKIFINL